MSTLNQAAVEIRQLTLQDVPAFRALRLAALRENPEAFSASLEEEERLDDAAMAARAVPEPPSLVLGGFSGGELVGMAGYIAETRPKTSHKATMVAVYVSQQWRKSGLGRRLVERIVSHARSLQVILHCRVNTQNEAARGLYHSLGFTPFGIERDALFVNGRYYDEELLALDLRNAEAG